MYVSLMNEDAVKALFRAGATDPSRAVSTLTADMFRNDADRLVHEGLAVKTASDKYFLTTDAVKWAKDQSWNTDLWNPTDGAFDDILTDSDVFNTLLDDNKDDTFGGGGGSFGGGVVSTVKSFEDRIRELAEQCEALSLELRDIRNDAKGEDKTYYRPVTDKMEVASASLWGAVNAALYSGPLSPGMRSLLERVIAHKGVAYADLERTGQANRARALVERGFATFRDFENGTYIEHTDAGREALK
jgi:hypothetical protein